MLETEHLKAIGGGTGTSTITNATDCLELYQATTIPQTRGGYDNKFRKLCGLGIYSKDPGAERHGEWGSKPKIIKADGNTREGKSDSSEYP